MGVWGSGLKNHLKIGFFRATVESVLLYGAECWTVTGGMVSGLDGACTGVLGAVLGVSWRERGANRELCGGLPGVAGALMIGGLRFVGRCWGKRGGVVGDLLLWGPGHGARKRGRPALVYQK